MEPAATDRNPTLEYLKPEREASFTWSTPAGGSVREIGQRLPSRDPSRGLSRLTPRELEVARLVAQRKSNKAIGKQLGMKTRTASTHLSNIYQKLRIGSRGELADIIRDQDIMRIYWRPAQTPIHSTSLR